LVVPFIVKMMIVMHALKHFKISPANSILLGSVILIIRVDSELATNVVRSDKSRATYCEIFDTVVSLKMSDPNEVMSVMSRTIMALTTLIFL